MGDDYPTRCERCDMRAPEGQTYCDACQRVRRAQATADESGWGGLTFIQKTGVILLLSAMFAFIVSGAFDDLSPPDGSHRPNPDADVFARTVRANQARREEQEREQRERERKQEKARLAAIEAARPPAERAALATEALTSDGRDAKEAYCRARELLDPIEPKDRGAADVRRALSLVKVTEARVLQAERAAFEQTRGLMCRDGTMSPTCRCHGPHRGCCSHHRGVAGCEPLPTEVSCP
ncbi:hypothetical protein WMF20_35230 [Sorangium sp. So ce834]|uniref:hypothetical protein n=1 Tax=Sorangium sp. So ce834 TaxID=3133321 RepID=UPI003F635F9E